LETYDPKAIEAKWQRVWEDARAFYVDDPAPGEEPDGPRAIPAVPRRPRCA